MHEPGVIGGSEEVQDLAPDAKRNFERDYERVIEKNPDIKLKDTNGWSDLSKMFRGTDEREGKEVAENIDTLLVFVSRVCPSTYIRRF